MAIKPSSGSSVCHERESRTADDSDDHAVPLILPSVVRDLGCTTPGCLEASLVCCLQRKDSRRPSKARVPLDPVPWESSGSLNAGRHRRGSGRAVQIVPPFLRALVQQAPGSSTLGCISRRTLPNDGCPQASLPSVRSRGEHAQVVSQGHGQMHLAMDADRDLVSYCARPQLQLHTPTRSLPPAQPTLTACPIPATKIEGSTQTLDSDILWCLMLCRQSSKHWSHTAVLIISLVMQTVTRCPGIWQQKDNISSSEGIDKRCSQHCQFRS